MVEQMTDIKVTLPKLYVFKSTAKIKKGCNETYDSIKALEMWKCKNTFKP